MISLLENVDGKISDFGGIKYTNENFADFLSCLHFQSEKYGLLWGSDENILTALVPGSRGGWITIATLSLMIIIIRNYINFFVGIILFFG